MEVASWTSNGPSRESLMPTEMTLGEMTGETIGETTGTESRPKDTKAENDESHDVAPLFINDELYHFSIVVNIL